MKTIKHIMTVTTLLAFSSLAVAKGGFQDGNAPAHKKGERPQQGFVDESLAIKNVSEALKAEDNAPVILVGSIVKQLDHDEFLFKDSTGEVEIEVKKRAWNNQTITPQDTIEIRGKVDKEWAKTEIDVRQIIKK